METIPRSIIELADRNILSPFELACRQAVVEANPHNPTSLSEFVTEWGRTDILLPDGFQFTTTTTEIVTTPILADGRKGALCHLDIMGGKEQYLHLVFMARESIPGCESPIVLSNTRVSPNKAMLGHFNPYAYYDSLIYFMHRLAPTGTELKLFVRQYDTRTALDQGTAPQNTPLVKVFNRAGWNLNEYIQKPEARRFRHVLGFD